MWFCYARNPRGIEGNENYDENVNQETKNVTDISKSWKILK